MSVPEDPQAPVPVTLIRCVNGHYHVAGPCPICAAASAPTPTVEPRRALGFPVPRRRMSWLFRFNLITASVALLAVAGVWAMIFREPVHAPAPPPAAATAAPPVQIVAAIKEAPAKETQVKETQAAQAPKPPPAPDAAPPTQPEQVAALPATPLPLPRPAAAANDVQMASAPPQAGDGPAAVPLRAPQPPNAAAPPAPGALYPAYPPAAKPPAQVAQLPQPPRSSLPPAQRLGVPPSAIQQVRWLDGRTIEILVRALDQQPNETDVIEERPSGDVVRAHLRNGPRPCRYMEIYPNQRSNAFVLVRFCADPLGRWIGQEIGGQ